MSGRLHCYNYNSFTALWILSRITRVSRYQKGKTNLDLLEQETVSGSGISWAIRKSASCPRQITMPASHHSFLQPGCPSCHPTNSIKAVKYICCYKQQHFNITGSVSAFSALKLLVGWQVGHPACKILSGGMLAWLCVWVKVQICTWHRWCHCHPLSHAPVNPDWFYLPGFTFLMLAHPGSPRQNTRGP